MIPFLFFENFKFFLRRAQAARGPYFLLLQKVGKDRRKGVSPPLRIPGPKWGAGRPPLETPKSRCAIRIGRTPRRLRGWSFGAVGESASACALATIAAPPPLRVGGCAPWPPTFPKGESLPIMRASAWYRARKGFYGETLRNAHRKPAPQRGCGFRPSLARLCRKAL